MKELEPLKHQGAGKGSSPRNCLSKEFKDNFEIAFGKRKPAPGKFRKKY